MSSDESITLTPRSHDKLGIYHCGVTREGFVSIAGAPHNIADGESITDERSGLSVTRQGSEYTFSRAS